MSCRKMTLDDSFTSKSLSLVDGGRISMILLDIVSRRWLMQVSEDEFKVCLQQAIG